MKEKYIGKSESFKARYKALGIECFSKRVKHELDEYEKNLRTFIDIDMSFRTVYCITYEGKEYDCGELPRDMGNIVRGIAIAKGLVKPT